MNSPLLNWLLLALCVGLSFVLSGMETGVFALSRLRVRQQMRAGRSSARRLHHWLENPENFLWTILVGNTVVNFFILGTIFAMLHAQIGHRHALFAVTFIGIVFVFYALCDLLPKMLFQKFPNRLCLALARPFRFIHLALRPLVALVEWGSGLFLRWTGGKVFKGQLFGNREEFRQVMQETGQGFTTEERVMINRVLDLQSLTVQSVTTPIAIARTVTAQTTVAELFAICRETHRTRFPVWDLRDQHRRIVGLVDLDRLIYGAELKPGRLVGEFILPAVYLDENLRVEEAMRRLRRAGQMLAIVMREDREVGIVSMQDILSKVFGEVKL
jgi:CBS domain containing-hemolysin-like protein